MLDTRYRSLSYQSFATLRKASRIMQFLARMSIEQTAGKE
jgi:hypothetical protein